MTKIIKILNTYGLPSNNQTLLKKDSTTTITTIRIALSISDLLEKDGKQS